MCKGRKCGLCTRKAKQEEVDTVHLFMCMCTFSWVAGCVKARSGCFNKANPALSASPVRQPYPQALPDHAHARTRRTLVLALMADDTAASEVRASALSRGGLISTMPLLRPTAATISCAGVGGGWVEVGGWVQGGCRAGSADATWWVDASVGVGARAFMRLLPHMGPAHPCIHLRAGYIPPRTPASPFGLH